LDEHLNRSATLEVEGTRQRGRPRKTWKEVVNKDIDDLHIKLSDAMDCSNWRKMIGGNWNDRSRQ